MSTYQSVLRSGGFRKTGLVAAIALGAASLAATAPAEAHYWHRDNGGAVAAGVIGGLAVGALVGSALAAPPPPVVYEEDEPVEYVPAYRVRHYPSCENFRRVDWRDHVWFDDEGGAHPCD